MLRILLSFVILILIVLMIIFLKGFFSKSENSADEKELPVGRDNKRKAPVFEKPRRAAAAAGKASSSSPRRVSQGGTVGTHQRQIAGVLVLLSLAFLLFGACLKFDRGYSEAAELADDLVDAVDMVQLWTGTDSSLVRDAKAISSRLEDGKITGAESLAVCGRAAKLLRSLSKSGLDLGSEANGVRSKLQLYRIAFVLTALLGLAAAVMLFTGRGKKLTIPYAVLLLVLLVVFLTFKQGTSVGWTPFAALFLVLISFFLKFFAKAGPAPQKTSASAGQEMSAGDAPQVPVKSYCPHCGCHADPDARFCVHCGKPLY